MTNHSVTIGVYTVHVEIRGGWHKATWGYDGGCPAESPEVDITSIVDEDGEAVTFRDLQALTGLHGRHIIRMIDDDVERTFRDWRK